MISSAEHAFTQGAAMSDAPMPAALVACWAESDATPRLILDAKLRPVWLNQAARSQLERRRDLELREGVLSTTNGSYQADLAAFVTGCGRELSAFCLPCDDGDGHVLFRGQEIEHSDGRFFGLIFYRSGSEFSARYADLDTVFQLTQSEHRVLQQMIEGHTADEISSNLYVSIETTRSHIRQIYLKLNVTSREGLFSRIRPYRV